MVLIFFFVRSNLKQLLRNLNHQKNAIKNMAYGWMGRSTTFLSQVIQEIKRQGYKLVLKTQ